MKATGLYTEQGSQRGATLPIIRQLSRVSQIPKGARLGARARPDGLSKRHEASTNPVWSTILQ